MTGTGVSSGGGRDTFGAQTGDFYIPHLPAADPAGPALYWTEFAWGRRLPGRPVAGLSVKPGRGGDIFLGIPVRTPACYVAGGFSTMDSFYVKERFLTFTKWIAIPLMQPILIHGVGEFANKPSPGAICLGR